MIIEVSSTSLVEDASESRSGGRRGSRESHTPSLLVFQCSEPGRTRTICSAVEDFGPLVRLRQMHADTAKQSLAHSGKRKLEASRRTTKIKGKVVSCMLASWEALFFPDKHRFSNMQKRSDDVITGNRNFQPALPACAASLTMAYVDINSLFMSEHT